MARGSSAGRHRLPSLVGAPLLLILTAVGMPATVGSAIPTPTNGGSGITANVTWNGASIDRAGALPSALSVSLASTAHLWYNWSSYAPVGVGGARPIEVGDARLQMFYFGAVLATRDVVVDHPLPLLSGAIDMAWSPGGFAYLLEGAYRMTASLLDPNGSTLWSESFFIHAIAPYDVAAALPALLLIIGVYELYSLVRSGRHARSKGRPGRTPPAPAENPPAPEGE